MFPDSAALLQEQMNTENISGLEKQKHLLFIKLILLYHTARGLRLAVLQYFILALISSHSDSIAVSPLPIRQTWLTIISAAPPPPPLVIFSSLVPFTARFLFLWKSVFWTKERSEASVRDASLKIVQKVDKFKPTGAVRPPYCQSIQRTDQKQSKDLFSFGNFEESCSRISR